MDRCQELDQTFDSNFSATDVEQVSEGFAPSAADYSELLTDAIEAVSMGVVLVASDGGILYANQMALDLMRCRLGLRSSYGRLVASTIKGSVQLPVLVNVEAAPSVNTKTKNQIIALSRGEGGQHLFAYIVPVQSHPGGAAIFIVDPEHYVIPRLAAFALRYRLTPGEARVLNELVSGQGLVAAARSLDIAESTARTHLRRVFGKTGAGRQTELLHLYLTGALPALNASAAQVT
jgi:DNA-binding CsgD family transcriptional regulator